MNKIIQLISDGDGAPSTMRFAVLLIIVPIMTVWTVLSIKAGQMIDLDVKWIGLIAAALAAKTGQSFAENASGSAPVKPAGGTPALPGAALILAFSLLPLALFCTGCKTVNPGQPSGVLSADTNGIIYIGSWQVKTNDVYNGIKIAATIGTQQGVKADTNSVLYFSAVEQALTLALDAGQITPAQIQTELDAVDANMPNAADVSGGVQAGLTLYQAFFGAVVSQNISDASPYLVPALTALRDGIIAGLPQ
jgi:hypothetical protein